MTTTTTKTVSEAMELKFIASVPQALLDYLWSLANSPRYAGADSAVIELHPLAMGDGIVQEILFQCDGHVEERRVFGFQPVSAILQVDYNDHGCVMHLVDWMENNNDRSVR